MDLNVAVFGERLSWRRFVVLLQGLSHGSWWSAILGAEAEKPRVLEGAEVDAYFASQAAGA